MNLKLGWKKGKGISMASIRERNGKFNITIRMIPVNGDRSGKHMIQKQKQRSEKEKSNINRKWAHLL